MLSSARDRAGIVLGIVDVGGRERRETGERFEDRAPRRYAAQYANRCGSEDKTIELNPFVESELTLYLLLRSGPLC